MTFRCVHFDDLTKAELYDLIALRLEVFCVEQDCPYQDLDYKDQKAYHVLGEINGEILAYTRLVPKGVSYEMYPSIGRVITSMKVRRDGYGKALMEESIRLCQQYFGESPIKISAQTYLKRFYKGLGFEQVGEGYLEDNIPHIPMLYRW